MEWIYNVSNGSIIFASFKTRKAAEKYMTRRAYRRARLGLVALFVVVTVRYK